MSAAVDNTTETETTEKTSYYKMYKVIMHNDPKTSMDFVTAVLMRFYEKDVRSAMKLMIEIHEKGAGLAGVYPYEGAEFRVEQTHSIARTAGFPLSCSIEPE
jgi:ATP-dependent Clp protease adaptor protein ClpS